MIFFGHKFNIDSIDIKKSQRFFYDNGMIKSELKQFHPRVDIASTTLSTCLDLVCS